MFHNSMQTSKINKMPHFLNEYPLKNVNLLEKVTRSIKILIAAQKISKSLSDDLSLLQLNPAGSNLRLKV